MEIRIAKIEDLEQIVEIYNQAVLEKFATADTELISIENKIEWFLLHKPEKYPIFVCCNNNKVVGWCSISPYRPGRNALRYTAEISYYIHKDFRRQGIAQELIKESIDYSKSINLKRFFAIVLDRNIGSIKLLEKFGFEKWGHLPNVADFDGVECGHLYFGLRII